MFDASGNPIALVLPTAQRERDDGDGDDDDDAAARAAAAAAAATAAAAAARAAAADGARAADGDDGRWRQLYRLEGDAERQRLRAAAAERGGLVLQSDWKGGGAPRATEAHGARGGGSEYLESAGDQRRQRVGQRPALFWPAPPGGVITTAPCRAEAAAITAAVARHPSAAGGARGGSARDIGRAGVAGGAQASGGARALGGAVGTARRLTMGARRARRLVYSRPQREALETALRLATSSAARAALIDLQRAVASYGRLAKPLISCSRNRPPPSAAPRRRRRARRAAFWRCRR